MHVQKMKFHFNDYPFISQRYWSFTTNDFYFLGHCLSFMIISSKFCKTLQLQRSSDNTQTLELTHYNPPPMLGLIIIKDFITIINNYSSNAYDNITSVFLILFYLVCCSLIRFACCNNYN